MRNISVKLAMLVTLLFAAAPVVSAVEYEWEDAAGTVKSLDDYKGKPVILHFWASWCPPCRGEMPELSAWSKEHKDVKLVVVALDRKFANADAFLKDQKIGFPTLMGDMSAAMRLGARGLPTTLVIGPDGEIVKTRVGTVNWNGEEGNAILQLARPAVETAAAPH